jgi:putative transposase
VARLSRESPQGIAAFDFFTVPTVTLRMPYWFFVIEHQRRKILHCNVTSLSFLEAAGLEPKRTSVRAPWQNGLAERWIGSCRREILDHIIALNEQHLRRVMHDYVNYNEQDRLHDSLQKDAPNPRVVE